MGMNMDGAHLTPIPPQVDMSIPVANLEFCGEPDAVDRDVDAEYYTRYAPS